VWSGDRDAAPGPLLSLSGWDVDTNLQSATFDCFARWIEPQVGTPGACGIAAGIIAVWAAFGPYVDGSDTLQLLINPGTTSSRS